MSTIRDTDTFLVNRGGSSYQVEAQNFGDVQDSDLLLVNRGGASFQCSRADVGNNVRDDDALLVNRSGASFQLDGLTFKSEMLASSAPDNWVEGPTITNAQFSACAAGGGVVIAVDERSSGTKTSIIVNGSNYSTIPAFQNLQLSAIAYGEGKFVVGLKRISSDAVPITYYSTDNGQSWTASNPVPVSLAGAADRRVPTEGIVYNSSKNEFVMLMSAEGTRTFICTSADGITWTATQTTELKNTTCLSYINGKTYGNYQSPSAASYLRYSTDDVTWQNTSLALVASRCPAGNDTFVTAASTSSPSTIYRSTDGIQFTEVSQTAGNSNVFTLGYGGGYVIGTSSSSASVGYSPDGLTWTVTPAPSSLSRCVVYSDDLSMWHAFGANGFYMYTD